MISSTVIGNLGRDCETRDAKGTPVVSFNVASSDGFGDNKTTTWVRCSLFGQRATKITAYLTKGQKVACRGSMTLREYNGRDGTAKTSLEMRVDDVELLGGGQREGAASGARAVAAASRGDAYESEEDMPF